MIDRETLPYRPCAGVMLLNRDGLIFTGERLDMPGAWQMPQGGIDGGEDPEAAAFRELEEETGVPADAVSLIKATNDWVTYDLPDELLGKVWQGRWRGQKQKWFLMRLNGPDSLITIETDHPEFARWRWSDRDALLRDIVGFKQDVYQQVVQDLLPEPQ